MLIGIQERRRACWAPAELVQTMCSFLVVADSPLASAILATKALLVRELLLARSCTLRCAQHICRCRLPHSHAAAARLQPSRIFTAPGIVVGQQQAMIDSSLISSAICIRNSMHKRIKDYTRPPVLVFQNFHQNIGLCVQLSNNQHRHLLRASNPPSGVQAPQRLKCLCALAAAFSAVCATLREQIPEHETMRRFAPG